MEAVEDPCLDVFVEHQHCSSCIKISKCNVRPQEGYCCGIITCDQICGARFHHCKLSEHKLLCPNEKVPCINADNGCPVMLLRSKCGHHLETCPASVVHCTMEWNRWPVCSLQEHALHLPLQPAKPVSQDSNANSSNHQLDVALARRDQRMLDRWFKAPQKTTHSSYNNLTRRCPAVPFQLNEEDLEKEMQTLNGSNQISKTISDDELDTPWEIRKSPPGLQQSVCKKLYKASMKTTKSLSEALNLATNGTINGDNPDKENYIGVNGSTVMPVRCVNGSCTDQIQEYKYEEELMDIACSNNKDDRKIINDVLEALMSEESDRCVNDEHKHSIRTDQLFVDNTIVSDISSASMIDHAMNHPSPPPPYLMCSNLCINNDGRDNSEIEDDSLSSLPLGLNLTLESVTRYETKPKSMYTFLCAQEFRRDEYRWHYKNIHSEIHGGLNGWLEQRCPLAHYGCMFSVRRFFPVVRGTSIVHNDVLESFGIQPPNPSVQNDNLHDSCNRNVSSPIRKLFRRSPNRRRSEQTLLLENGEENMEVIHEDSDTCLSMSSQKSSHINLLDLPFEILQNVARCLDSFSLCNASMTCHLLREVCRSLLEERGLVVLHWERLKLGDEITWRIAHKRWFFSTSVTPVTNWGFEDKEHIGNHLKTCSYFNRQYRKEPYFYPFGIKPNLKVLEKLKDGIFNNCKHDEEVTNL